MNDIPIKTIVFFAALHIALFVVTVTLIARQKIRRAARHHAHAYSSNRRVIP